MLSAILAHIDLLEAKTREFDAYLIAKLDQPEEKYALALLRTIPGIDLIGAAMLLVQIDFLEGPNSTSSTRSGA